MEQKQFVSYCRRSKKNYDSELGIEAQKNAVTKYVESQNGVLIAEYIEKESGVSANRSKRIFIHQAILKCREEDAILVIARLGRLGRDVEFVSNLMNSKVSFICCDMPEANEMTIQFMAVMAEQDSKHKSKVIKAALAVKKRKGWKGGFYTYKGESPFNAEARKRGRATMTLKADNNPNNKRAEEYAYTLFTNGLNKEQIVRKMREQGFKSPTNKEVVNHTVTRWIARYKGRLVKVEGAC